MLLRYARATRGLTAHPTEDGKAVNARWPGQPSPPWAARRDMTTPGHYEREARLQPGARRLGVLLEARDRRRLLHGEPDVIQSVEQAALAMRIDVELHHAAVRSADLLVFEIDGERRIGAALRIIEQLVEILGRDPDGQNAVLEAVVVENVAELGGDHAADAEIEQCPGRMLAARAAAEIVAGDEDFGVAVGRLVEHEVGILAAVLAIAQLREQAGAEAGALDRLEVLLGDDHVGVDIDHVERRGHALQHSELVHSRISMAPRQRRL